MMGEEFDDPRCPECGGPIGPTATRCLHCSADLSDTQPVAPEDITGVHDNPSAEHASGEFMSVSTASSQPVEHPLNPDGVMDNTLTVLVGVAGGLFIGLVGTFVLLILLESLWALGFGLAAWIGSTAYLVRRRYLLDVLAKSAYGVALVILLVPLLAIAVDGGVLERGGLLVVLLIFVAFPATIAAGIGWFASRYVPDDEASR